MSDSRVVSGCSAEDVASNRENTEMQLRNEDRCTKCKISPPVVVASQDESLCRTCFSFSLFSRAKSTINKNKLIDDSENLLLGFSGGFSSRVALDLLQDIQIPPGSESVVQRGKIRFQFGLAYVDEREATNVDDEHADNVECVMREICENAGVTLHTVPLSFGLRDHSDSKNHGCEILEGSTLRDNLASISDATEREDFVERLRVDCLVRLAEEHGYSKVVLALNTSRMAAKVIAATSKGQGLSLPDSMAYVNRQHSVPVIFPLRDCLGRHLALHCQLSGLRTAFVPWLDTMAGEAGKPISINSLAEKFVKALQEENWSRESTIVRTAGKLSPASLHQK